MGAARQARRVSRARRRWRAGVGTRRACLAHAVVSPPPQLIRQFQDLAAGCTTDDYATVAPPAANMHTYIQAVANSCTDDYM